MPSPSVDDVLDLLNLQFDVEAAYTKYMAARKQLPALLAHTELDPDAIRATYMEIKGIYERKAVHLSQLLEREALRFPDQTKPSEVLAKVEERRVASNKKLKKVADAWERDRVLLNEPE